MIFSTARLYPCRILCKLPGESLEIPWHQDSSYWPLQPMQVLAADTHSSYCEQPIDIVFSFSKITYFLCQLWSVWDEYSNIQTYLNIFRRIYSFVEIFVNFLQGEYIRIFIRHLFMLTNIVGYSFVQYL